MNESTDGRLERAKDAALGAHRGPASHGDELGEATGGISGVLVGAGIGSAAGPIGTLIGGVAGALTGWWAGRAVSEAASTLTHEDDEALPRALRRITGSPGGSRLRRRARRLLSGSGREPQPELRVEHLHRRRDGATARLGTVCRQVRQLAERAPVRGGGFYARTLTAR